MDILITLLLVLGAITTIGHLIWLGIAALVRWAFYDQDSLKPELGPLDASIVQRNELDITERTIVRFYKQGKLSVLVYEQILELIRTERAPVFKPAPVSPPPVTTVERHESLLKPLTESKSAPASNDVPPRTSQPPTSPRPKRRSFAELLTSFMEESNIRWGEIIGGLLIIGCSTALVVSLWAQISQIPVLKFLIFTTVTAVLFGIGLYTEHRWKLPTTSRAILTIATLLVPLNFLAIAAVSAGNTPGALVITSELVAPAIFLCLVYFAGRIITPGGAQILAAGVLGSSVGQLLVRHFASVDGSPLVLILLGAFPVACYVITVAIALHFVLRSGVIREGGLSTIFTTLGTMSFAALLPFGLLLHKSGPVGMSMMYLAPLVTLWGLPFLATGTILWQKVTDKDLTAARTAATAIGLLGLMIVLAGMLLAWPNPASIVPAALLNFAVFTILALALRIPVAHCIAALCFTLAYLVTGQVLAGAITWQNLRVMSLLGVCLNVSSGQMLVGAFALLVIASEWLSQRRRSSESHFYLVASCIVAVVSLAITTVFGIGADHALWVVYGLYAIGAFWIACRHQRVQFAWIGSALLLFSLAHNFTRSLGVAFPWQTALLAHATLCAAAAIFSPRRKSTRVLSQPLNYSSLIAIVLGVICLFQANTWEVTWTQARRVFWIAGILLLLVRLNPKRILLNAFQIASICALVLTVKALLQHYEWYAYMPHAFLRPAALQIQGTVLVLFCLAWSGLRLLARRSDVFSSRLFGSRFRELAQLLDSRLAIDRLLIWLLLPVFLLFAGYGAISGVVQEVAALSNDLAGLNLAMFPHQEALGAGSWILLGFLMLAFFASFWERRRNLYLLGALAALSATIPLLAGQFEYQFAAATAWRWFAGVFLLCGSISLWYRRGLSRNLTRLGWPRSASQSINLAVHARTLLLAVTIIPIVVLTVIPALRAVLYLPVPEPGGIFSFFSNDFVYGAPLAIVALVLIGYALRERTPAFAFYGCAFFNAVVTLAFVLAVVSAGSPMDRVVLVRLVQLNAITLTVYILPWLATRSRWRPVLDHTVRKSADFYLKLQFGLAVGITLALFLPGILTILSIPPVANRGTVALASLPGWLSLVTISIAGAWLGIYRTIKLKPLALSVFLAAVACLHAFGIAEFSGAAGAQALTMTVASSAWILFAVAELTSRRCKAAAIPLSLFRVVFDLRSDWPVLSRNLAAIFGGITVFLCLNRLDNLTTSAWWSIAPLLAMTVLAGTISWRIKSRNYIYAGGSLLFLTVSLWWLLVAQRGFRFSDLVLVNIVANSLAGIVWLWLDLRSRRDKSCSEYYFSFHHVSAVLQLSVLGLLATLGVVYQFQHLVVLSSPVLTWLAVISVGVFLSACLYDRAARYAVAGLCALSLIAGVILLHQLELTAEQFAWGATIMLSVYSLSIATIWHKRKRVIAYARQFRMPDRIQPDSTHVRWLSVFIALAVATVVVLTCWINIDFMAFELRVSAAAAVMAQFLTLAFMAEGDRAPRWRRAALIVFIAGAVVAGWSWLTPYITGTWLNRSVILMVVTFGIASLYGLLLNKARARFPHWTNDARACVPWVLGAGVVALCFCLATEVHHQFVFGVVLIHSLSLVTIGLALVAAIFVCVMFALSPNHDPLCLTERGRIRYVYIAELMLALLFMHIRLTMPWLFSGFIERYWPAAVMIVAYLGVVTSEALRRQKLLVLSEPLERTGAFLPLLPVLGFWLVSSEVDFSVLLFVVGGLYGLLSLLRRSFKFGVLAALAGNAGLWYAWHRTYDYQFLQHPQLWLIPVALSVLAAAHLNEDNLSDEQMSVLRYCSVITIYVSSTADIFVNGVANSPWLPLILGSLSLAGVFAGFLFRIRGLVILGASFLLLSLTTMIWYASANFGWTWLWYVAGIGTGAAIIFTFALFEKNQREKATKRHTSHKREEEMGHA